MKTFFDIKPGILEHSAVALGFFDGVHPGHQVVICKAVEEAKRLGAVPALATFRDHPRNLVGTKAPKLLCLLEQRLELFANLGIEAVLVLSFNEEICKMTPFEYAKKVLVDCLGARSVSVGQNHRFGRNREGNPEKLFALGQELGFSVHVAPLVLLDGQEVSSSRIRQALSQGQVETANKLLTHPFALQGTVVPGDKRGRALGFPTANLAVNERQLLPAFGVYAGMAVIKQEGGMGKRIPSVLNLGLRPTVSADQSPSLEVHLLDFDQDLYGQEIQIEFLKFLRAQEKFAGLEELKAQISADCQSARSFFLSRQAEPENKQPA